MATYLDTILAAHRAAAARDERSLDGLLAEASSRPPTRGFAASLRLDHLAVISEVKRRSPSKGDLFPDLVPADLARQLDLDALVEVHDERELARALDAGATLVGVNQRDLTTFSVDRELAAKLRPAMPEGAVTVAESGVRDPADAQALRDAGYDAV